MAILFLPTTMLVISKLLLFFSQISYASDTITQSETFIDGSILVSNNGTFELGFFSPGSSSNRYIGIGYKNIPVRRVVWVANRDNPIKDNSSNLIINQDGNLVLLNQNQTLLWSTNASCPIVQLLDNGNLVLRDEKDNNSEESYLWQSFDYLCDTLLPAMKIGLNKRTGLNRRNIAWKNWDDPSSGDFTSAIELGNNPEMVIWKGSVEYYRAGPWSGIGSTRIFALRDNPLYNYEFVNNEDEMYYMFTLKNTSLISIVVLNETLSVRQRLILVPNSGIWTVYQSLPDTKHSLIDEKMTLDDCRIKCLENCSCSAYASLNTSGARSGCSIWFGDLIDLRVSQSGQDLYVRTDTSDIVLKATNNLSIENKLGEGGFGPVYKGTLVDGQEIAVKRLSRSSRQGSKEFKNEVILCAKFRNLVKVVGCCVEGEEKMLLYEYMPNKSLDSFLFDPVQSKLLDWSMRVNILYGIARGLLYFHQDSRLRIIHRDLNVSNILLDNDMNTKFSDFGMARMCGGDQIEGRTSRIVGTYFGVL